MRKFALAILALPVLVTVTVGSVLRASMLVRTGVAIGLGALFGLAVVGIVRPVPATATLPTPIVPLTQAAFRTAVATGVSLVAPATIEFTTPMDRASVSAALSVDPPTPVVLSWSDDDRSLTIAPVERWVAGVYHTITVDPGALARTGRPLTTPARASFLTREPAVAVVGATSVVGDRVAADTAFSIDVDQAVTPASVHGAVRMDPPVDGTVTSVPSADGGVRLVFTPVEPLKADQRYQLVVDGVRDADGVPLAAVSIVVRTVAAPAVVRFRPVADARDVPRDQVVSVRFTRPMDRASTRTAFAVTADGAAVPGRISFAEGDTVLVFKPADDLPWDAVIVATVAAGALSAHGTALPADAEATFRTVAKPAPKATPRPTPKPTSGGGSGGGSVGAGTWAAVEKYYLGLMNCTRTGGTVTSTGKCSSPGGRDVAPLALSSGISSKVARPYAKLLATRNLCSHFIGGNPGDRLRAAGYTSYRWAENLGCRSGNAYDAVLASHLYFQSERNWSPQGGHYVNLMSTKYDRAGIGVWVASGRVRLVVVFYHP